MDCSTAARDEDFLAYPTNRLVAVFDSDTDAQTTLGELFAAGFAKSFDVFCGTAGARLIDFSGEQHGYLARLSRLLHHLNVPEGAQMDSYERELQAGHCIIMVQTDDADSQRRALDILRSHGAHFINRYGRWTMEEMHA